MLVGSLIGYELFSYKIFPIRILRALLYIIFQHSVLPLKGLMPVRLLILNPLCDLVFRSGSFQDLLFTPSVLKCQNEVPQRVWWRLLLGHQNSCLSPTVQSICREDCACHCVTFPSSFASRKKRVEGMGVELMCWLTWWQDQGNRLGVGVRNRETPRTWQTSANDCLCSYFHFTSCFSPAPRSCLCLDLGDPESDLSGRKRLMSCSHPLLKALRLQFS